MPNDTIEIIIRDSNYKKLEQFKANLNDKKLCSRIFAIIQHKYNLISDTSGKKKSEENTNWLDMNNDFFR